MSDKFNDQRREYQAAILTSADLLADPLKQFEVWYEQAKVAKIPEPNAFALATAAITQTGAQPGLRMLLLKGLSPEGFSFYTNYGSRKGQDLATNTYAAMLFFWQALERQIRIEGQVEPISAAESDQYFQQRPRAAQLGAWASEQSQEIASRADLEARLKKYAELYPDQVPRPPHWGGYILKPERYEFWQGRENRLHDRFVYSKQQTTWAITQLAP